MRLYHLKLASLLVWRDTLDLLGLCGKSDEQWISYLMWIVLWMPSVWSNVVYGTKELTTNLNARPKWISVDLRKSTITKMSLWLVQTLFFILLSVSQYTVIGVEFIWSNKHFRCSLGHFQQELQSSTGIINKTDCSLRKFSDWRSLKLQQFTLVSAALKLAISSSVLSELNSFFKLRPLKELCAAY